MKTRQLAVTIVALLVSGHAFAEAPTIISGAAATQCAKPVVKHHKKRKVTQCKPKTVYITQERIVKVPVEVERIVKVPVEKIVDHPVFFTKETAKPYSVSLGFIVGQGSFSAGESVNINNPAFGFTGSDKLSGNGGSVGLFAALNWTPEALAFGDWQGSLGAEVNYMFNSGSDKAKLVFPGSTSDNALSVSQGNSVGFNVTPGLLYKPWGVSLKPLLGVTNTNFTLGGGYSLNATGFTAGVLVEKTFENGFGIGVRYSNTEFGAYNLENGLLHHEVSNLSTDFVGVQGSYRF